MKQPTYIVHTGLYSGQAESILQVIRTFTIDYGGRRDRVTFRHMKIERETDGEVTLNVYDEDYYSYSKTVLASNSHQYIKKWLANTVKGIVKSELLASAHGIRDAAILKCEDWARSNRKLITTYGVSFSVDQAYAVYEILLGRDVKDKKYQAGLVEDIVGKPFDPVRVELENYRREELVRLEREYDNKRNDITNWYNSQDSQFEREYREEYHKLLERYKSNRSELDAERASRNEVATAEYEEAKRKLEAEINEALDNLQPQTEAASAA